MNIKWLMISFSSLCATSFAWGNANVVSINFGSDKTNALATAESGLPEYRTTYWNNTTTSPGIVSPLRNGNGDILTIIGIDGVAKEMKITYSSNGAWSSIEAGQGTDRDPILNGWHAGGAAVSATVENIPYATYDVILYYRGDWGNTYRSPQVNGAFYSMIEGSNVATAVESVTSWGNCDLAYSSSPILGVNTLRITNQTASALTVLAGAGQSDALRIALAAIQIVSTDLDAFRPLPSVVHPLSGDLILKGVYTGVRDGLSYGISWSTSSSAEIATGTNSIDLGLMSATSGELRYVTDFSDESVFHYAWFTEDGNGVRVYSDIETYTPSPSLDDDLVLYLPGDQDSRNYAHLVNTSIDVNDVIVSTHDSYSGYVKPLYTSAPNGYGSAFRFDKTWWLNVGRPKCVDTGDFTLGLWLKDLNTSTSKALLGTQDWRIGTNKGFVLCKAGDGNLLIYAFGGSTPKQVREKAFNTSTWHYVTLVFDRTNGFVTRYINGESLGTIPIAKPTDPVQGSTNYSTFIAAGMELLFGSSGSADANKTYMAESYQDEIAIWKRPLTADEVSALYTTYQGVVIPKEKLQPAININFNANGNNSGAFSAGVASLDSGLAEYRSAHWQQPVGTTGTNIALKDNTDTPTLATLTYSSPSVYGASGNRNTILNGWLGDGGVNVDIAVNNIPYKAYDVILYYGGDWDYSWTLATPMFRNAFYTINEGDDIAMPLDVTTQAEWGGINNEAIMPVLGVNTIRIAGQTASTFTYSGTRTSSTQGSSGVRTSIAALQIVSTEGDTPVIHPLEVEGHLTSNSIILNGHIEGDWTGATYGIQYVERQATSVSDLTIVRNLGAIPNTPKLQVNTNVPFSETLSYVWYTEKNGVKTYSDIETYQPVAKDLVLYLSGDDAIDNRVDVASIPEGERVTFTPVGTPLYALAPEGRGSAFNLDATWHINAGRPACVNTGSFTIGLWVNRLSDPGNHCLFGTQDWANGKNLGFSAHEGGLTSAWGVNAPSRQNMSFHLDRNNEWQYLTLVVDRTANTITTYRNGGQVDIRQLKSPALGMSPYIDATINAEGIDVGMSLLFGFSGTALKVDGTPHYPSYSLQDEIAIWKRPLTASDVSALYHVYDGVVIPKAPIVPSVVEGVTHGKTVSWIQRNAPVEAKLIKVANEEDAQKAWLFGITPTFTIQNEVLGEYSVTFSPVKFIIDNVYISEVSSLNLSMNLTVQIVTDAERMAINGKIILQAKKNLEDPWNELYIQNNGTLIFENIIIDPKAHQFLNIKLVDPEEEVPVEPSPGVDPVSLKVMAWNIWGGKNLSDAYKINGVTARQRVVDILKDSDADIICMQETYGSAAFIAQELDYHYYTSGSEANLCIFSRYPLSDMSSDSFVKATVTLPSGKSVRVHNIHLSSGGAHIQRLRDPSYTDAALVKADLDYRYNSINNYLTSASITAELANADTVPVIFAGDFNWVSYLDYTAETKAAGLNYGRILPIPTSLAMADHGLADTYRICHPVVTEDTLGYTWVTTGPEWRYDSASDSFVPATPEHSDVDYRGFYSRIDYIYSKGITLKPTTSRTIIHHRSNSVTSFPYFPSDHAAVLTTFTLTP